MEIRTNFIFCIYKMRNLCQDKGMNLKGLSKKFTPPPPPENSDNFPLSRRLFFYKAFFNIGAFLGLAGLTKWLSDSTIQSPFQNFNLSELLIPTAEADCIGGGGRNYPTGYIYRVCGRNRGLRRNEPCFQSHPIAETRCGKNSWITPGNFYCSRSLPRCDEIR